MLASYAPQPCLSNTERESTVGEYIYGIAFSTHVVFVHCGMQGKILRFIIRQSRLVMNQLVIHLGPIINNTRRGQIIELSLKMIFVLSQFIELLKYKYDFGQKPY